MNYSRCEKTVRRWSLGYINREPSFIRRSFVPERPFMLCDSRRVYYIGKLLLVRSFPTSGNGTCSTVGSRGLTSEGKREGSFHTVRSEDLLRTETSTESVAQLTAVEERICSISRVRCLRVSITSKTDIHEPQAQHTLQYAHLALYIH
jgi:hypothetical protein